MGVPRRTLKFASLDDAVADAESLLATGYTKLGNWSLGQVCGHLANWLTYPLDGFPRIPLALQPVMWAMRKTIGRGKYEQYVGTGTMKAGSPTIPESVPPMEASDAMEVARFRAAAERLMAHQGPIHPSPLFGPLSKEQAVKIQVVHTAHHLSFLVPEATSDAHPERHA